MTFTTDIYYRHLLQAFTTDTTDCDPDDSATPYLHRVYACQKRPVHIHMAKEAYSYGKRGLFIWQKRPVHMAKEAYSYGKRGLFLWQKRPIPMAKEAYSYGKRGLFIWQKRPVHMAKEAYSYGKRGLFLWQKRPIPMAKEAYEHLLPRTAYERGRQHDGRL
jgi:recombinational DNA repair protein RecT